MKFVKIFGWIFLIGGIGIIFWSLYSSYNIFTGKEKAPEIFQMEKPKTDSAQKTKVSGFQNEIQKELEKIVSEQLKEIFPEKMVLKFLNLISWSIFAGLLIFGGSQISSLGIKMIKG